MRLLIDLQGYQSESRLRGIGRYSLSLVKAMIADSHGHDIYVMLNEAFPESIGLIRSELRGILPPENIVTWCTPYPVFYADPDNLDRRKSGELIREFFIRKLEPDVVLITSLFEGIGDNSVTSISATESDIFTAVILYDLIPLVKPDEHFLENPIHQDFLNDKLISLQNADLLLSISESSRLEALENLEFSSEKIKNISGSISECFLDSQLVTGDTNRNDLVEATESPYILYSGGGDARKNIASLIHAYAKLPLDLLEKYRLVVIGKIQIEELEKLESIVVDCEIVGKVDFLGYVPDAQLVEFYKNCKVFVFPSTHEGMGLPPIEAMACGAPVIASNNSSLPEVVGLPEALFDPFSIESISSKLAQVLQDSAFYLRLLAHGEEQVKLFSWARTANSAWTFIQEGLDASSKNSKAKRLVSSLEPRFYNDLACILKNSPNEPLVDYARCIDRNMSTTDQSNRLLVDISVLHHTDAKSGIQRVARSILNQLLDEPPRDIEVVPMFFDEGLYRASSRFLSEEVDFSPVLTPSNGDKYLALDLTMHLTPETDAVYRDMKLRGVQLNFVVYDLLLIKHPEWWLPPNPQLFKGWLDTVTAVADNLVCISQVVAGDLEEWIDENQTVPPSLPARISSFNLGADILNDESKASLSLESEALLAKLKTTSTFIVVGTLEPRKGHLLVLSAFESLWERNFDFRLVIVGKAGWLVDELVSRLETHKELGEKLLWLSDVSDEYLQRLYDESSCLIMASEDEGFGLPLVEAAQNRLPIIARDIPIFREVANEHATFFSGRTGQALADELIEWDSLYSKSLHIKSDDMPIISWKQSADELLLRIG